MSPDKMAFQLISEGHKAARLPENGKHRTDADRIAHAKALRQKVMGMFQKQ